MNKLINLAVILFILGFIITILYPIITNEESGIKYGLISLSIGSLIIIISLTIERINDNKKFKKEFKKEDLRP